MELMLNGPEVADEERKNYTMIASDRSSMESSPRPSSSNPTLAISQEDQLNSTKAKMGEVREENERLKMILAKIVKDYQSLEMQFFDTVRQEHTERPFEIPSEEPELISLSLGTNVGWQKKELEKTSTSKSSDDDKIMEKGLTLGLDCTYQGSYSSPNEPRSKTSPDNSIDETKDQEEGRESSPPRKMIKNLRNADDEVSPQTHVKKARVSVRARCDAPTMNDGCQWRKYGQKIAKGNPCPRAYYRCTVAPSCPVRKQVQRCQEDMSILITTYEGAHNHPLPISATAMASTTSAAACMLTSGSSTSSRPSIGSPISSTTATAFVNGLNFGLSDNSRTTQLYLPNPTISSTLSHPTITLDLTAPPSTSQIPHFNRFSAPRYPSTSLNFSSSESNTIPSYWNNYNRGHHGPLGHVRQTQDSFYQSYMQKATITNQTQQSLTDTIAKAITSDPSFQSALASAITSYVGSRGAPEGGGEGSSHGMKWGDLLGSYSGTPSTVNGCASSYLTSSSSNPQQGSLMLLKPPLGFSASKSASASPVDNRENTNN